MAGSTDEKAYTSHLIIVMQHVIKWLTQTGKRSMSWVKSIGNSRKAMKKLENDIPSINKTFLQNIWDKAFKQAKRDAEKEMGEPTDIENLTYKQVFDDDYQLPEPDKKDHKKKKRKNK